MFTDASKYSYSGILHQEKDDEPDTLIPIAYLSGSFSKTQQLWNTTQKECYAVCKSVKRFSFISWAECTLYCDHKPLASFLTTGMSSHVLDRWALELQQFNIKFNHIEGKKNVVADTISRLKATNLYEKHQEVNSMPSVDTVEDALENIIEEIHNIKEKARDYNQNTQLDPNELHGEQKCDQFCKNKAKDINSNKLFDFILDNNGTQENSQIIIQYIEPTIVISRKLRQRTIFYFHEGKGHQGITQSIHMIRQNFWWIRFCLDVQHYISTCKLCVQFYLI